MKQGRKSTGKGARIRESAVGSALAMAIPFPAGVSILAAEEAQLVPHFTLREQHVGGWLAEGKTDPEIARILGLGLETVRSHIKSMREKAGVENRSALLAWIWRNRFAFYFYQPQPRKGMRYS